LAPTVGIAATGFCYPGGILQAFIDKINKFFIDKIRKLFHRQDQQILRLPTAATTRSHLVEFRSGVPRIVLRRSDATQAKY
jgi:hypothetical protein